jgi:hypothetical protein
VEKTLGARHDHIALLAHMHDVLRQTIESIRRLLARSQAP